MPCTVKNVNSWILLVSDWNCSVVMLSSIAQECITAPEFLTWRLWTQYTVQFLSRSFLAPGRVPAIRCWPVLSRQVHRRGTWNHSLQSWCPWGVCVHWRRGGTGTICVCLWWPSGHKLKKGSERGILETGAIASHSLSLDPNGHKCPLIHLLTS